MNVIKIKLDYDPISHPRNWHEYVKSNFHTITAAHEIILLFPKNHRTMIEIKSQHYQSRTVESYMGLKQTDHIKNYSYIDTKTTTN